MQSPAFAAVPVLWTGTTPATADVNLGGSGVQPTNVTVLGTAGALSQAITAAAVLSGNGVVATVASTVGMVAGQTIVVNGAAGGNWTNMSGVWVIQAVISSTQVVFTTSATCSGTYTASSGTLYVASPGTKVSQIDLLAIGTTVAGDVNIFARNPAGTTYYLVESVVEGAFTSSTSSGANKVAYTYDNLVLPAGWSLCVTSTVAGNDSLVEVNAFGAAL